MILIKITAFESVIACRCRWGLALMRGHTW